MVRLLYLFMMFSIVGWLWETPWVSIRSKRFINRGFLRGPYIPIYGCAVVTIVFTMGIFNNMNHDNVVTILIQIIYMALITASWEFVTSWLLEKMFKTRWWDYSSHKFNIQGRVSLYVTVFFGLGGYALYRFVLPMLDNIYNVIAVNQVTIILSLFYLFFTIDSVVTIIELFKTKNIISQINRISKELSNKAEGRYKEFQVQYHRSKKDFIEHVLELKDSLNERLENLPTQQITGKLKEEFRKLNMYVNNARRLNRFYKKYPNSKSFELFQVLKSIENLQNRKKGDK